MASHGFPGNLFYGSHLCELHLVTFCNVNWKANIPEKKNQSSQTKVTSFEESLLMGFKY